MWGITFLLILQAEACRGIRGIMNRIEQTFKRIKAEGQKAFIPYVTAGDPDMKTSKKIILELAASGADIIELGIPFSDPLADGPTIQRAVQRSLSSGTTTQQIFDMVSDLRRTAQVPFVFMTYYNIVLTYGVERFIKDAAACGADGLIVPDLPMEESEELFAIAKKFDFCVILIAAPTTPPSRFKRIAKATKGVFILRVNYRGNRSSKKFR